MFLAWLVCTGLLEIFFFNQIPNAGLFLSIRALGLALIVLAAFAQGRAVWVFREWYPILYVACCYREMATIIPAIRHFNGDRWLADLDFHFWGANPTVWFEKFYSPALTEYLQVIYTLFIPVVLLIPVVLWLRRSYEDFTYTAFLLALGFLVSYVGYLIVPARGPRILLADLQTQPLRGLWLFHSMQAALDGLEKTHYDCFPSGHTELSILACWSSRLISRTLFRVYLVYTACIILATVYLRYHYSIDIVAGALTALGLILTGPRIYSKLQRG